jgi:hypothetical protein
VLPFSEGWRTDWKLGVNVLEDLGGWGLARLRSEDALIEEGQLRLRDHVEGEKGETTSL